MDPEVMEAGRKAKLDSCTVQVEPQLNADMERLQLPESLLGQLNIHYETTPGGLVLNGMYVFGGRLDWSARLTMNS